MRAARLAQEEMLKEVSSKEAESRRIMQLQAELELQKARVEAEAMVGQHHHTDKAVAAML